MIRDRIVTQLHEFYLKQGIHPSQFKCRYEQFCQSFAYQGNMTEAKMSMIGSRFGKDGFPRIVVISIDPPKGGEDRYGFVSAEQRTTEYIAEKHEAEDYAIIRPNPNRHWGGTQIIVKDILILYGFRGSGQQVENVCSLFTHVNVAKCSVNMPNNRQASKKVLERCSSSYLMGELAVIQPEILITQGKQTNIIMGNLLISRPLEESDLPYKKTINVAGIEKVLWLPMHHPSRQRHKILAEWPFYIDAVQKWKKKARKSRQRLHR